MTPANEIPGMSQVLECIEQSTRLLGLPTADALAQLMHSLESDAALNELGWFAFAAEAAHALNVQRNFAAVGLDLTAARPARDILIGGLPRTGTTLLHHLLAASPELSTLRSWEAQFPTPTPQSEVERASAVELSAARYDLLQTIAPVVGQMHPLDAEGIEECTPLLQHSLLCLQIVVMFRIPGYGRWLAEQDMTAAYRFWNGQLSAARARANGPLVLKSPLHFVGYEPLLEHHAPRLLVHIRRPVQQVLSSFLQLVEATRAAFTDRLGSRSEIALEWAGYLDPLLTRATRVLNARRRAVLTVEYEQLVSEPSAAVADVCDVIGIAPPPSDDVDVITQRLRAKHSYQRRPYDQHDLGPALEILDRHREGPFLL